MMAAPTASRPGARRQAHCLPAQPPAMWPPRSAPVLSGPRLLAVQARRLAPADQGCSCANLREARAAWARPAARVASPQAAPPRSGALGHERGCSPQPSRCDPCPGQCRHTRTVTFGFARERRAMQTYKGKRACRDTVGDIGSYQCHPADDCSSNHDDTGNIARAESPEEKRQWHRKPTR